MRTSLFSRIKKDLHFRIKTFLCLSIIFNIAYSIFLFITAILYSSKWFFIMSVYYAFLSCARIFIFTQINPEKSLRLKISTMRACGFFLLLINVVISVMMFILIYRHNAVGHHEITVITIATYTFYSLTVAIITSVKHIKQNNYVYISAKIINLTCASVSMVTLTNTMLSTFGENVLSFRNIILPILSGIVSIFIIISAILMIHKANLRLRILNENEKERQ